MGGGRKEKEIWRLAWARRGCGDGGGLNGIRNEACFPSGMGVRQEGRATPGRGEEDRSAEREGITCGQELDSPEDRKGQRCGAQS